MGMNRKVRRMRDSSSLRDALLAAGFDNFGIIVPDNLPIILARTICEHLGMIWHGEGEINIGVEPLIVFYETAPQWGRAEFTEDIGDFLNEKIVAVARIAPSKLYYKSELEIILQQ